MVGAGKAKKGSSGKGQVWARLPNARAVPQVLRQGDGAQGTENMWRGEDARRRGSKTVFLSQD